jgi:hypothetical protein
MLKSRWTVTTAVAVLAGALAVVALDSPSDPDEALLLVGRDRAPGSGQLRFQLEGRSVRGLFPGATRQMRITVRNPLGVRFSLQQLTAEVSSSSRRGCAVTPANLQVRQYSGRLPVTVEATGSTRLAGTVPVVMPMGASQKCAGAGFVITLSGVGMRMGR